MDILHGGGGGGRGGWKGDSNFTLLLTDRDEELDFTKVLMTYIQYLPTCVGNREKTYYLRNMLLLLSYVHNCIM